MTHDMRGTKEDPCTKNRSGDRERRGARPLTILFFALVVGGAAARLQAQMAVSLAVSPSSPAPVGMAISVRPQVFGAALDDLWYRFRVREIGGSFRTIRDYGPLAALEWTSLDEGFYVLEVSVRNRRSLEVATASLTFRLISRVPGDQAVISPTSHPLVFLFSSPACESGRARVQFRSAEGFMQSTPEKPCVPGRSLNFYLAGLAPSGSYDARLVVDSGRGTNAGPQASFRTGELPESVVGGASVIQPAAAPSAQEILLQTPLFLPPIATDLSGRPLWYGPSDLAYLTRPGPPGTGTFFGIIENRTDPARDAVRRFDLVGMTVQETNVARVNEQLGSLGKRPISGFHHEARSLPDGKTLLLAAVEEVLTGVQGTGPVDVIGDMILVLDADLQVVWSWDAFDHLDMSRRAVLGETCVPGGAGCPPLYRGAAANDWTHGNSVQRTPDGALLYSARHQDWLIKIDYRDGAGNGDVIWRLGKDGDFAYDSADPYPWFSHQHDAGYEPGSRSTITLFDNGNTRVAYFPGGSSRGQAIQVDEERGIVRPIVNVDLGMLSGALGSAQKLLDGTYHFEAGLIRDLTAVNGFAGFSIQVDSAGNLISSIRIPAAVYRSFRMGDLYNLSDGPGRFGPRVVDFRN